MMYLRETSRQYTRSVTREQLRREGKRGGKKPPPTPAAGDAPTMQFDDELNSQLLAVLDDF